MRELRITSHANYFRNNYILVAIGVVLSILSIQNVIFVCASFIYHLYLFKKCKAIFLLSLCLSVVILLIFLIKENRTIDYSCNFESKVLSVYRNDNYTKLIVRKGGYKVLVYDYGNTLVKVGNIIRVSGEIKDIDTFFIESDFDYKKYLHYQDCMYVVSCNKITIIKDSFSLRRIRQLIIDYFDNNYSLSSASFLKALIIGESGSLDSHLYENLKKEGIVHLFAISGLHTTLLSDIVSSALKKIKRFKSTDLVLSVFLLVYAFLTDFLPSVLRAVIMKIIGIINKNKKLKFSTSDIVSIAFLIQVLINPYNMFKQGFILSYTVCIILILVMPLVSEKTKVMQAIISSSVISIVTLPIIINLNNSLNRLVPLYNVIFIFIVSYILLPLSLFFGIFNSLSFIYDAIVKGFSSLVNVLSSFTIDIRLAHFSYISIIIFVSSILFAFSARKRRLVGILALIIICIYQSFKPAFNMEYKVNFLDLYYGESTVIFSPFKKGVIIIDTGDGSNNKVTEFLKYHGVRNIELLIITHNHEDHNGEVDNLIKEFNVCKIVSSEFDDRLYGKDYKVKAGDIIKCNGLTFKVLSPAIYSSDINDNSIVMSVKIGNFNYLFMGDSSISIEKEIKVKDIDVIKIGHHGSNTSTSEYLLEKASPSIAIIMSGRKKIYGFPSTKTVNLLKTKNIKVFSTSTYKQITIHSIFSYSYLTPLAFTNDE